MKKKITVLSLWMPYLIQLQYDKRMHLKQAFNISSNLMSISDMSKNGCKILFLLKLYRMEETFLRIKIVKFNKVM